MNPIGIGLYGINGHQILGQLTKGCGKAFLAAVAGIPEDRLPENVRDNADVARYPTLDALLVDDRVGLVSLCSPRRCDQADEAVRCLEAGRHVYAEKPCALSEADLDRLMETAARTGRVFHEMAGTAFDRPYRQMRRLIAEGVVGTVVQVSVQKSYPMHDNRPQDEEVDGGLILQNGVHALRFVEHVAGVRVAEIEAVETGLGNPKAGGLRVAASMMMKLENGGVATAVANYLNPPAFGSWGNEMVRVFGTEGLMEAVDGGVRTRLVLRDEDKGPLPDGEPSVDYLDLILDEIVDGAAPPLSPEEELHPTRMVIRAKASADAGG